MKTVENIYLYDDYRTFLIDYFNEQKRIKKAFSYRYFAKKAGFGSPSFVSYVLRGERNLSISSIGKMVEGLSISGNEADYFKNLVLCNQAKTSEEKDYYFKVIKKLRSRTKFASVNSHQIKYYQNWYYHVIRELVELVDWKGDYSILADCLEPKINAKQAEEAVKTLLKIGLIKKEGDRYYQIENAITAEGLPVFFIKKIRRKFIELGMDAIDEMPINKRHFSSVTVSFSDEMFDEVSKILDETRRKIANLAVSEKDIHKNKVFQINFQAFPLSSDIKKVNLCDGED